jgi:Adenylate and Guanylate cyclase catalytic domain
MVEENKRKKKQAREDDDSDCDSEAQALVTSNQIADHYPSCTVLSMDLVGFTAWCSSRCPADTFCLLETLYGAFDKIAKDRKIYKVEMIGGK